MKKIFKLLFTLILFTGGIFVSTIQVSAENSTETIQPVEILKFNDLPNNEKEIFLENGFNEDDTYNKTIIEQYSTVNPDSEMSTFDINVVTVFGSTKKTASNRAQSTYSISSSKLPIKKASVKTTASGDGKKLTDSNTISPGTKKGTVTTNITHSGASTYFTFKGDAQVTTTAGVVGWVYNAGAGGATIGF